MPKIISFWNHDFTIHGDERDAYYNHLPNHDLSALMNYLTRLARLRPPTCCLDVGANIGLSALAISTLLPKCRIVAFEPAPTVFPYLEQNIADNNRGEMIELVNLAIGRHSGSIRFDERADQLSGSLVSETGNTVVQVTTLDDFVRSRAIAVVDFIKIDVEGYEPAVLEGARNVLFVHRPVVMLEYNPWLISHTGGSPAEFIASVSAQTGLLAVVDASTGKQTLLPANPADAVAFLEARQTTGADVFDLVNFAA